MLFSCRGSGKIWYRGKVSSRAGSTRPNKPKDADCLTERREGFAEAPNLTRNCKDQKTVPKDSHKTQCILRLHVYLIKGEVEGLSKQYSSAELYYSVEPRKETALSRFEVPVFMFYKKTTAEAEVCSETQPLSWEFFPQSLMCGNPLQLLCVEGNALLNFSGAL